MKPKNLIKSYGSDSWAIITGATDGIGWGFSQKLAKLGFNIIMISRTEQKQLDRSQELQAQNPSIKIKIIPKDFTQATSIEFFEEIFEVTQGLDISILVNNIGMACQSGCSETLEKVINTTILNTMPQTMLSKFVINKLKIRRQGFNSDTKVGAIIDIGSYASVHPFAFLAFYSASKMYASHLSLSLSKTECGDYIDFQTVKPHLVSTAMTNHHKVDFRTVSVEDCVDSSLKALGNVTETFGASKHVVIGFLTECFISLGLFDGLIGLMVWFSKMKKNKNVGKKE